MNRQGVIVGALFCALGCGGGEGGNRGTSGPDGGDGSRAVGAADGSSNRSPCDPGTERCPCYGNGTCNAGLTCASDLCVRLEGGAGGSGGGDAGLGDAGGERTATQDKDSGSSLTEGGAGGRSAVDAAPPVPVRLGDLGQRCQRDGDCESGLICVAEDSTTVLGGGIQGGLCTAECAADPSVCSAIDPGAVCLITDDGATPADPTDDTGYCFEGCVVGDEDAGKCHGRLDMACYPAAAGASSATCEPACTSDRGCGDRVCDLGLGVCVDPEDRTGALPIGAPCDPTNDACEGFCQDLGGYNVCSGVCNFSGIADGRGCGTDPPLVKPLDAACLDLGPDASVHDAARCLQLCDCNDDCRHPGLICQPWVTSVSSLAVGERQGSCRPPTLSNGIACN